MINKKDEELSRKPYKKIKNDSSNNQKINMNVEKLS